MAHEWVTSATRVESFTPTEPHLAVVVGAVVVGEDTGTLLGRMRDDDEKDFIIPSGETVIVVGWAMFKGDTTLYSKRRGYPVVIARGRYGWLYSQEIEEL